MSFYLKVTTTHPGFSMSQVYEFTTKKEGDAFSGDEVQPVSYKEMQELYKQSDQGWKQGISTDGIGINYFNIDQDEVIKVENVEINNTLNEYDHVTADVTINSKLHKFFEYINKDFTICTSSDSYTNNNEHDLPKDQATINVIKDLVEEQL